MKLLAFDLETAEPVREDDPTARDLGVTCAAAALWDGGRVRVRTWAPDGGEGGFRSPRMEPRGVLGMLVDLSSYWSFDDHLIVTFNGAGFDFPVIREAIRTLSDRGLVHVKSGCGTYVRELSHKDAAASFELFLKLKHSAESFERLSEVRRMIEIEAAGLAAKRATAADHTAMEATIERMPRTGLNHRAMPRVTWPSTQRLSQQRTTNSLAFS